MDTHRRWMMDAVNRGVEFAEARAAARRAQARVDELEAQTGPSTLSKEDADRAAIGRRLAAYVNGDRAAGAPRSGSAASDEVVAKSDDPVAIGRRMAAWINRGNGR